MTGQPRGGQPGQFEAFYVAHFQEITAYVRRRVPAEDAADVVAQVFTVAWRRFGSVPAPPQDRLWLFGVARKSVADQQRSAHRRLRLHARLSAEVLTGPGPHLSLTLATSRSGPPSARCGPATARRSSSSYGTGSVTPRLPPCSAAAPTRWSSATAGPARRSARPSPPLARRPGRAGTHSSAHRKSRGASSHDHR